MRVTRLAIVAGIVVLGVLCWLAAAGATAIAEVLITVFALVVLVGGGNWLSGRDGGRTPGARPRSSVLADDPTSGDPAEPPGGEPPRS